MARTPNTVLNKSGDGRHLCLIFSLGDKALNMLAIGLLQITKLRKFSFRAVFLRVF